MLVRIDETHYVLAPSVVERLPRGEPSPIEAMVPSETIPIEPVRYQRLLDAIAILRDADRVDLEIEHRGVRTTLRYEINR